MREGAGEGYGYPPAQGVADQGESAGRVAGPGEWGGGQGDEELGGVEARVVWEVVGRVGVASAE